jgi:predicted nucleic acid-binding protein
MSRILLMRLARWLTRREPGLACDAAARHAGRINADLEGKGLVIGLPDVMIAAIALSRGIAVVTGTHFEYVQSVGYELSKLCRVNAGSGIFVLNREMA